MVTAKWRLPSGAGTWSVASDWTPAASVAGDDVIIGSSLDTGNVLVTEDITFAISTLKMAAKTGGKGNITTLTITPGAILTVYGPISLGNNAIIDGTGTGTFLTDGAISDGGTITASNGLVDLEGNGSIAIGGAVPTTGTATASTLKLNIGDGVTARGISCSGANQTPPISPTSAVIGLARTLLELEPTLPLEYGPAKAIAYTNLMLAVRSGVQKDLVAG